LFSLAILWAEMRGGCQVEKMLEEWRNWIEVTSCG